MARLHRGHLTTIIVVVLHLHHLHHLHLCVHLSVCLVLALHGLASLLQCLLTGLVPLRSDAAEENDAGQAAAENDDCNDNDGNDAASDRLLSADTPASLAKTKRAAITGVSSTLAGIVTPLAIAPVNSER